MSWKKYFTQVPVRNNQTGQLSPVGSATGMPSGPAKTNYSSFLPDVYSGAPNRIERYGQYNVMDLDSEVNAALDILAEFCSQLNKSNDAPFIFHFKQKATSTEIQIIKQYLQQWCKLNNFNKRMFKILRNDISDEFDDTGYQFFNTTGTTDVTTPVSLAVDDFRDYVYTAGVTDDGIGTPLQEFNQFAIKIVMQGTNGAEPPRIRDLRVIALAT